MFGISPMDLDDIIIELSEKLNEDRRSERQNEAKTKKIADQISSRGPAISLPKITSPIDILQWIKMYKKITNIVDSDISKLALIKQSLIGSDKKSTDQMDKIVDVLSYIKQKYMKEDIILRILSNQAKELQEPWTTKNSLRNIERFLVIVSHFCEWGLQRHINSKFRSEMVPLLFCQGTT